MLLHTENGTKTKIVSVKTTNCMTLKVQVNLVNIKKRKLVL